VNWAPYAQVGKIGIRLMRGQEEVKEIEAERHQLQSKPMGPIPNGENGRCLFLQEQLPSSAK